MPPMSPMVACLMARSGARRVGRAAGAQGIVEQFEPVLPPEHLAVEHIGGRTEDVARDGIFEVEGIDRLGGAAGHHIHEGGRVEARLLREYAQNERIAQVALLLPYGGEGAAQEGIGALA